LGVVFGVKVWEDWGRQTMNANANEKVRVMPAADVPWQPVAAGRGVAMQMLIGPDRAPHFLLRRFRLEPGGGMPKHTNQVEHEQFVLGGRAQVGVGEAVYEVQRGDILFIPAGVPHWYQAQGEEPFEFLCIVPNLPDRMDLVP